jgi:hypothetical protein
VTKIVSAAQHAMLTRAAQDPHYANSRGISQDAARQLLDDHTKGGAPALPDRAAASSPAKRKATPRADLPVFLTSRRDA